MPDRESVTENVAGTSRRIYIIGGGGSGKTTLARRLGPALAIDPVELDLGADLDDLARRPEWIVEGIFVFGVGVDTSFFSASSLSLSRVLLGVCVPMAMLNAPDS